MEFKSIYGNPRKSKRIDRGGGIIKEKTTYAGIGSD